MPCRQYASIKSRKIPGREFLEKILSVLGDKGYQTPIPKKIKVDRKTSEFISGGLNV